MAAARVRMPAAQRFPVALGGGFPVASRTPALISYGRRFGLLAARTPGVLADWEGAAFPPLCPADWRSAEAYDDGPLPDRTPDPGRALASGGSTGRPKIIIGPGPWARAPGTPMPLFASLGFGMGQ